MTVYNVGLPRTATRSIANLFEQFRFKIKHAMLSQGYYHIDKDSVMMNLAPFKEENTFYSDTPVWHPIFWEALELKDQPIIHTFRDKESWINSVMNFNYFMQQQYLERDLFWYSDYFNQINTNSLAKVYDKHLKDISCFNNIISINLTNDQPDLIIDKICSHLKIERKSNYELPIIGKNIHKKPVVN